MKDSSTEIYKAFFDILDGNITYSSADVPVYTNLPGNNVQDYIYIGEQTQVDAGGHDEFAAESTMVLYVVTNEQSNFPSKIKLQNISDQVYNAIMPTNRTEIATDNFYTSGLFLESSIEDQFSTDSGYQLRKTLTWRFNIHETDVPWVPDEGGPSGDYALRGNLDMNGFTIQGVSEDEMARLIGVTAIIQNQLDGKQATLVSGTNIKTINSSTILGSGNVNVQEVLVNQTNIKSINGNSLLGSGDLTVSGGGEASDFAASTVPADGGSIESTTNPLIVYNNPAFLSDGTTEINDTNIDAEITFETSPGAVAVPFNATVDTTRRIVDPNPSSPLTKGQLYRLAVTSLKDADGNESGAIDITFTATYTTAFQAWMDAITGGSGDLPTNLNDLDTLYVAWANAGLFSSSNVFNVFVALYTGTDSDAFLYDMKDPTISTTIINSGNEDWVSDGGTKSNGPQNFGYQIADLTTYKQAIIDGTLALTYDRRDTNGDSGDYIAGITGQGFLTYGSGDSVRVRHDDGGTTAGLHTTNFTVNGNGLNLIQEATCPEIFGIGGVTRASNSLMTLSNHNAYIGLYIIHKGIDSILPAVTTAWDNYVATL